jgi:hypothetical protein
MTRRLAVVLSGLLFAACGTGVSAPAGHAISGTLAVPGSHENGWVTAIPAVLCVPIESYGDMIPGAQVEIDDENGTIIGLTSLAADSPASLEKQVPFTCRFVYRFSGVPDAKFYRVKVGRFLAPPESAAQLAAANWTFQPLSLTVNLK